MAFLKAGKMAIGSFLRANRPINGFEAGKRFKAMESAYDKMGGLKGMLTRDAFSWSDSKAKALGMAVVDENGKKLSIAAKREAARNLGWGKIARSAFMNSDGSASLSAIGAAYVGGNMVVNGNMGIPFVSSK